MFLCCEYLLTEMWTRGFDAMGVDACSGHE